MKVRKYMMQEEMMKKVLTVLLVICLFAGSAEAKRYRAKKPAPKTAEKEFKFRDVPDSHWAAKAVYKLVKLGVTQGYPDGTFRGTKYMTRFETAGFLAKLAENLGVAGVEKLGAELKSELKDMRAEITEKNPFKISGRIETDYYIGNIFASAAGVPGTKAPSGPVFCYRLITSVLSSFEGEGSLKITLDSMDGGFYGGSQDLLTKLIDAQAIVKTNSGLPSTITATVGPGPQRHLFNSNVMPSEYNRTYMRPYTGVKLDTSLGWMNLSVGYNAHNIMATDPSTPGAIAVNQVTGQLSWNYSKLPVLNSGSVSIKGDYFSQNTASQAPGLSNLKSGILITANPNERTRLTGELKAGCFHNIERRNLAAIASLSLDKVFNDGNNIDVKVFAAGSEYIVYPADLDEWSLIGFDPFDRPRVNGARAAQITLMQTLSDTLTFAGRANLDLSSDYRYGTGHAGSRYTIEGSVIKALNSKANMTLAYRVDQDPNSLSDITTDLFMFGISCGF